MDFSRTEASVDLAALTRDILADHAPDAGLDRPLWTTLAAAGVLSAALPEAAGGNGYGLLEQCAVLIELGTRVAPVPYLETIATTGAAIARFGTPAQLDRWAAPAAAGNAILTSALTEEHNEDPTRPTTTAEPTSNGWKLVGGKSSVAYAAEADAIAVPAQTPDGPGLFLVTTADEGVRVQDQQVVDATSTAWLDLDNVEVDRSRRLADPEALAWLATQATIARCALQLGVLDTALTMTADHARTRVQFDRPIASFQAVTQRLADAYVDVEAVRLTLWQAAWRHAEGLPCQAEVATAKFWAAEAGHRVAHTAVHIHGGLGIDLDYPLHRYFIAAKRNEFELGGATTQLRRLGAILAAEPA